MPLRAEKRFDVDTKICNLKDKLYSLSGTMPMYQTLLLRNNEGECLAQMDNEDAPLKSYPIFEYATIHIVDSDPANAMARLMDPEASGVKRQEMSDEDYAKRQSMGDLFERNRANSMYILRCRLFVVPRHFADTFRTFKKTVLKEHFDSKEEELADAARVAAEREVPEIEKLATIKSTHCSLIDPVFLLVTESISPMYRSPIALALAPVGDRCELSGDASSVSRRGSVQHLGTVDFQPGVWVGIRLDEPLGKNDGSVKGKKYFEAGQNYGVFAKPSKVNVGDYPERNELDELDEEL